MEQNSSDNLPTNTQPTKNSELRVVMLSLFIALVSGGIGYYLGMKQQPQHKITQQVMQKTSPMATPTHAPLEESIAYTLPPEWNKKDIAGSFLQKGQETPLSQIRITSPGKAFSDNGTPANASGVDITIVKFINPKTSVSPLQLLTGQIKKNGITEITQTLIDNQPTLHYFTDASHTSEVYVVVQGAYPSYTWNIAVVYNGRDQSDIQAQKNKYQAQVDQFIQSIHFK